MLKILFSLRATLLTLIVVLGSTTGASAHEAVSLPNGQIQLTIGATSTLALGSPNGSSYRICWRKTYQSKLICNANEIYTSDNPVILSGFVNNQNYKLQVTCWCVTNAITAPAWVATGNTFFKYVTPPPVEPTVVQTSNVRIRGVDSNRCIYMTTVGPTPRHWGCWGDPNMTFQKIVYDNGAIQFKHVVTGRCLWGERPHVPPISSPISSFGCNWTGTNFQLQNAGPGGKIRLNIPVTKDFGGPGLNTPGPGGCLLIEGNDATPMMKAPCTQDSKFVFVLDPA